MLCTFPLVPQQLCKGSLGYYQVNVRNEKSVLMIISFLFSMHNRKMNYTTVHGCIICVFRSSSCVSVFCGICCFKIDPLFLMVLNYKKTTLISEVLQKVL